MWAHVIYLGVAAPCGFCPDLAYGAFKKSWLSRRWRPAAHATFRAPQYETSLSAAWSSSLSRPHPFFLCHVVPAGSTDSLNLGTWTVDELRIYNIGSWTPDGAYVRVARCDLRPGPAT
ncbi:hypothetical protein BGW80DRAFT_582724 [Lactifluus volemus]|nr:hypothetical protein BGW80DRAFT_582724 [Lactifluus volemus]